MIVEHDGWTEWNGGDCPVPDLVAGRAMLRCGSILSFDGEATNAKTWNWKHGNPENIMDPSREIVRYQLKPADADGAGDNCEALTLHALPVVDVMITASTEPGRATNPKDAIGSTKLPLNLWPAEATAMGCLGMLEGAEKYGRNNFIAGDGVVASIYVEAAKRHLDAWFAGEEVTHDTAVPHLANALATIAIVVKCQAHGKLIDDRDYSPAQNGSAYRALIEKLTPHVTRIKAMFKDKKPRHYTIADVEQRAA